MKFDLGVLDELSVLVLVENASPSMGLLGKAGLSILLTARHQSTVQKVLLDVGPDPEVLLANLVALGIAPRTIDLIVLSHNHADHTAGLGRVVREIGRPGGVPIVAHPSLFRRGFVTRPRFTPSGMQPGDSGAEVEAAGGVWFLAREPLELMPGLYSAGEVERTTDFEAAMSRPRWMLAEGTVTEDRLLDDQCIVANIAGRGLVIVTGCSHSGIVNICRHAQKITGVDRIEAIIGGFHLLDAGAERVAKTVATLSDLGPAMIASGHCTGFEAEVQLQAAFGERYRHMTVNSRYRFGPSA